MTSQEILESRSLLVADIRRVSAIDDLACEYYWKGRTASASSPRPDTPSLS